MTTRRDEFRCFLRGESGAVTVDYVMLAAAVTGMALASSDVITRGMAALASSIDSELSGEPVERPPGLTYTNGFDNGSEGWSGAGTANIRGLGNVLGPIAGSGGTASITRDFIIDPDATEATFVFDLLALDTLDNESGIVFIDGREVGRVTSTHGRTAFTSGSGLDGRGITIEAQIIDNAEQLGGAPDRGDDSDLDSRTTISIRIANPNERVTFGFGSTADQSISNESFALDNFKVTGLKDPGGPA